eukprot:scaffold5021_cov123-Isochrysis_galbana.AAC.1
MRARKAAATHHRSFTRRVAGFYVLLSPRTFAGKTLKSWGGIFFKRGVRPRTWAWDDRSPGVGGPCAWDDRSPGHNHQGARAHGQQHKGATPA